MCNRRTWPESEGGLKGAYDCPHGVSARIVTRRQWDEQIGCLSEISFRLSRITLSNWSIAMLHSANTQWYFPLSVLASTPSTSPRPRELYDRARGIEFLFRLGSSLALSVFVVSAIIIWRCPQTHFSHVHSSNLVSSFLYEILHEWLSPSSTSILTAQGT